ncbi:MAG TPA: hypothetical protein VJU79_03595 [Candidatus Dormibacteraeota bacterium]|nr:hypothetical protein [Candidatus Dormibacteraeota bacterium]
MTTYKLYVETGPKHMKTMVHVLDLLGCVSVGKTTDEALDAAPPAITAFRRFMRKSGENIDDKERFTTRTALLVTEGQWLGNGSPYIVFPPDLQPATPREIELFLARFHAIYGALGDWAATQSDKQLDAKTAAGRTGRAVLLHALGSPGAYLSAALSGAPGLSRIATAAERGELALPDGMRQMTDRADELVRSTTREQRAAVRERGGGRTYTLRKALRRMLEHGWEHLAELARRPGGPELP